MPVSNVLRPTEQITVQGLPAGGALVYLYEPGTTTPVTSYSDSGLVTPNPHPVKLTGAGRGNIWISRDADMVVNDKNGNLILSADNVNPDALGNDKSGGLVPNGSFELDSNSDGVPDGWTLASDPGSSNALDNTQSTSGSQSFRFTSTGTGGGSLTTTDFFPVNDTEQLRVNVDLFSSLATVLNIVRVEWYDVSQVSISNSDIYSSTANPTVWTTQNLFATPPVGARFAKLRLIGIDPSVLLSGNTYFDNVSVFYPAVVSGVFDNITIQDNQIITTNLNGDLELGPNGTGAVNISSNNAVSLSDAKNPLNIGTDQPASNGHMALGESTIQRKTNGTTAGNMAIQPLGGILTVTSAVAGAEFRVAAKTYLADAGVVDLANDDNALNIGPYTSTSPHLAMDRTQIQAKANETTAGAITINGLGGNLTLGEAANTSTTTIRNLVNLSRDDAVDLTDVVNALNIGAGDPSTTPHMAFDQNDIQAKATATTAADLNIQRLGANLNLGPQSGTGAVSLYHNGNLTLQTSEPGVAALFSTVSGAPGTPDAITDTFLEFRSANDNLYAEWGFRGSLTTEFTLRSYVAGGDIRLAGTTTAGGAVNVFDADPDGAAELYHAGERRILTTAAGVGFNGGAGDTLVTLAHNSGFDATMGPIAFSGGCCLKTLDSGEGRIVQTDFLGTEQEPWLTFDRDAAVTLFRNGDEKARTASDANGALEINKGSGWNRVLDLDDLGAPNETGTFTPTWSGFAVGNEPANAFTYERYGNLVIISVNGGNSGVSNATNMSFSGLPVSLRPSGVTNTALLNFVDDAGVLIGYCNISATGVVSFIVRDSLTSATSVGFTNVGNKGVGSGFMMMYSLEAG